MKNKTCLAEFPVFVSLAIPALSAPPPQIEDLGAPQWSVSVSTHVNVDGSVIGGFESPSFSYALPFVWTRFAGLRRLDVPGGVIGSMSGMSDDGTVAVGTNRDSTLVILWDTATGAVRSSLPFDSATGWLSGDGSTVYGRYASTLPWQDRSYRWRPGAPIVDLGDLGGGVVYASDISEDGSLVIGSARTASGEWRAFRWTESTGMQAIPGLGAGNNYAVETSADGAVVVGHRRRGSAASRAYRWTVANGMEDLGAPIGTETTGVYLSADGRVVTGTYMRPDGQDRAFRWTPATGFVELAPGRSVYVTGTNRDGTVIVGYEEENSLFYSAAVRWTEIGGLQSLASAGNGSGYDDDGAVAVSLDGSTTIGWGSTLASGRRAVRWHDSGNIGGSYCGPATPNSTGASGEMSMSGSNVADTAHLILKARQLPPGTTGVFLHSRSAGLPWNSPWQGLGLCLSNPVGAFLGPGQIQRVDGNGEMSFTLDPTVVTGPSVAAFGRTFYFQAWYREVPGAATESGVTNAAYLTFF